MSHAAPPPAIELHGLTKTYRSSAGPIRAVDGIDLTINAGEIVALLGPNGAGKTTMLDMVLGLIPPTGGTVRVLGTSPKVAVTAGRVSAVLQTGGLLVDLTVRETVRMIASLYSDPAPVDEVIARAGIESIAGRRVGKCSGGERQRLRFALALLPDPDLLILDEPTAGMDVSARRAFWDTMRADAAAGRTVVFATHYLEEAEAFAERVVVVAHGRVVADGTTEEVRSRTLGRTVAADLPDRAAAAALRSLPGVSDVEASHRRVRVTVAAEHSDGVARALLAELGGTNLEITTLGLEAAFMDLTSDSPTTPTEVLR